MYKILKPWKNLFNARILERGKDYFVIVLYMKKIEKYPDGKEMAEQIAKQWKESYQRRPAMMDELKKAGF